MAEEKKNNSITNSIREENKRLKKDKKRRKVVIFVFLILILALIFILVSRFMVVAYVNGRPISRFSVIKQLESQGGQEVVDNLINKSLIEQEASDLNINISDEDVENEIKNIEELVKEQGMTLEEALELQGQTKNELTDNIRIQMIIEAVLAEKIEISQEDIQAYFDENKDFLGEDAIFEEFKDQIRDQLAQQEMSNAYQEWITNLKEQANIKYLIVY